MMMLTTYLFVLVNHRAADHRAADVISNNKPRFIQTEIVVYLLNTTTLLKCDVLALLSL